MKVKIEKMDNLGRGIAYINNKIVFVPKSYIGDILDIDIILDKKNYSVGKINSILEKSNERINVNCPYYSTCGGCDVMHISYEKEKEYKIKNINELLKINNINFTIKDYYESKSRFNYRNKVTLKIINGVIGYYESDTHNIVEINNCLLVKVSINNIIKDLKLMNIINGEVVIRSNYKDEVLISINSLDNINIEDIINKHKNIVGIIINDKVVFGKPFIIEKVNDLNFQINYNSFFQINTPILEIISNKINDYLIGSKNILDLYCGVGALSLISDNSVLGVEINKESIKSANINKDINNKSNASFICSDTKNVLNNITSKFDTIIFDPPRSGVHKSVLEKVMNENINIIIYMSCYPNTLIRDLHILIEKYDIIEICLYDMFPNTHHIECVCVLEMR